MPRVPATRPLLPAAVTSPRHTRLYRTRDSDADVARPAMHLLSARRWSVQPRAAGRTERRAGAHRTATGRAGVGCAARGGLRSVSALHTDADASRRVGLTLDRLDIRLAVPQVTLQRGQPLGQRLELR